MSDRDTRRICRYGAKCYQRNPEHTKKFKHPPINSNQNNDRNNRKRNNPNDSNSSDTPNKKQHLSPDPSENVVDEPENEEKVSPEPEQVTDEPLESEKVADVEVADVAVAETAVADIAVADAAVTDAAVTDAAVTDSVVADAAIADAAVTDSAVADAAVTDAAVADAVVEDTAVADAVVEDTAVEDAVVEDAAVADAEVVDAAVADVTDADVAITDIVVPEQSDSSEQKITADEEKADEETSSDKQQTESESNLEKIESVEPEKVPDIEEEKQNTIPEQENVPDIEQEKQNIILEPEKVKDSIDEKPVETVTPKEVTNEKVLTEKPPTERRLVENYTEANELIAKLFLAPMPKDFFKFYDFCKELKPSDPTNALKIVDIKLVGPYDVLNGLIDKDTPPSDDILTHWRYFYDLPEFQTVLKGNDKEGLHFGYWRDRPSSEPIFVALNSSNVSHKFKPTGENLFAAVAAYIEDRVKRVNPFEKSSYNNMLAKLKAFAKQNDIVLDVLTPKMKSREKNVVSRTIHGAGIVCPYNKKSQLGYRELSVTDNQLLKIVKKIDNVRSSEDERASARAELSEVVRLATIAGDECDFGTCLELGHDLLSTGCVHVQNAALAVFDIAYNQLERHAFLKIVQAHMKNRKKGTNLSSLSESANPSVNLF